MYRQAEGFGDLLENRLLAFLDEGFGLDAVHLVESQEQRRIALLGERDG